MDTPLVSIVMTYYERSPLLRNTLWSFVGHHYGPEVEVIVVDDASIDERAFPPDFPYRFKLRILYVSPEEKWYHNPCIPFNKGFSLARGETVILQNAECLHYDNIVKHAISHVSKANYLSYACYSIDENTTKRIASSKIDFFSDPWITIERKKPSSEGNNGWYNHSQYNPTAYHFCSAISKQNLMHLGGFDEKYAYGIGYDDNEFLERIRKANLDIRIVDSAIVIHQYHYNRTNNVARMDCLRRRNKELYYIYTKHGSNFVNYVKFILKYYLITRCFEPIKKTLQIASDEIKKNFRNRFPMIYIILKRMYYSIFSSK